MRDMAITSEAEIAEVAKVFLELNNWSVYPEVVIDLFEGRPDYVCEKHGLCQVVECKKTLTYPVIEQLARWQLEAEHRNKLQNGGYVKHRPIAIPHLLTAFVSSTNSRNSLLKQSLLDQYRIGVFSISKRPNIGMDEDRNSKLPQLRSVMEDYWHLEIEDFTYIIRQESFPKLQNGSRDSAKFIIERLNKDMRCTKAGLKGGEADYMTPFKRTMNRVKEVLSDGKERHIQHIIDDIKLIGGHHYSSDKSAVASIPIFIDKFSIAIRTRKHGAWFQIIN